jgi:hypothetical protein
MPEKKRIKNEMELAMLAAQVWWGGTSMVDGAVAIMEQVRRTHPEQFEQPEKRKSRPTSRSPATSPSPHQE